MALDTNINEALLKDLFAVYTEAENQMLEKVAKRVKKGVTTEGWNEQKLKDTQQLRKEIELLLNNKGKWAKSKVGKGILKAYKEGVNSAERDAGKPVTSMKDLNVPLTIQNMLLTNYNLIDDANSLVLRKVNDVYRDTMAESATGLLSGVDTRLTASQKMMDKLASKGITSFTDKAGRQWQMSSYTEMAMRTSSAHAAILGQIQTQESLGFDLMKVSSIGTTCPICGRWQGVVLSISGKTPGYHSVDEARSAGLFHPNCRHTLLMYDPDIDGPGKQDLNSDEYVEQHSERYNLTQQQRVNERNIRYWKRREAASIEPNAKFMARQRVKDWQYKNLLFCEKHNLQRDYAREGVRTGKATGNVTPLVGGNLKEYENLYSDVVGSSPKTTFLKLDIQHFGHKSYDKWLKDEITSLDELDIDKAMLSDPKNKSMTLTSMYKKYISDTPTEDFAHSTSFKKGTNEYKTGYAKFLKEQVADIGVGYQVKPQKVIIPESDLKAEIKSTSLTVVYKKYFSETPSADFKAAGGESGTGLSYAQWLKSEVNTLTTVGTFKAQGSTSGTGLNLKLNIHEPSAVPKPLKLTWTESYDLLKSPAMPQSLTSYINDLDSNVTGIHSASQAVKLAAKAAEDDPSADNKMKYDAAKLKDLSINEKAANQFKGFNDVSTLKDKIKMFKAQEQSAKSAGLNKEIIDHISSKKNIYVNALDELDKINKAKSAEQAKSKAKAQADALAAANSSPSANAYKMGFGTITTQQKEEFIDEFNKKHLSDSSSAGLKQKAALTKMQEDYIKNELGVTSSISELYEKAKNGKASPNELAVYALYDYTKASGVYTWYMRGVDRGRPVSLSDHPLGVGMSEWEYGKFMSKHLERYFRNVPQLQEEVYVHRVFGHDALENLFGIETVGAKAKVGTSTIINYAKTHPGEVTIRDYSALSTSTFKEGSWNGNCEVKIKLNKGVRAAYDGPVEAYKVDEMTLKPNQKLRINAIYERDDYSSSEWAALAAKNKFDKNRQVVMFAEAIPDEAVNTMIDDKVSQIDKALSASNLNKSLTGGDLLSEVKSEGQEFIKKLSSSEKKAIIEYTGGAYSSINSALRKKDVSSSYKKNTINQAIKALDKASTSQDRVYRRGSDFESLVGMLGENPRKFDRTSLSSELKENPDKYNSGTKIIFDDGFVSTTPMEKGGFGGSDVEFRLFAPKGTKAGYIAPYSQHKSELETVFQAGTRFRLLKIVEKGKAGGPYSTQSNFTVYLEALTTE